MNLWPVEHFHNLFVLTFGHDCYCIQQKWGQICCKSVQLVRGSSFRNDLLQHPYFRALEPTHAWWIILHGIMVGIRSMELFQVPIIASVPMIAQTTNSPNKFCFVESRFDIVTNEQNQISEAEVRIQNSYLLQPHYALCTEGWATGALNRSGA